MAITKICEYPGCRRPFKIQYEGKKYCIACGYKSTRGYGEPTFGPEYFFCRQIESLRSQECSGMGYKHGKDIGVCSVCLGEEKRRANKISVITH